MRIWPGSRWLRVTLVAIVAVLVIAAAGGADLVILSTRINHVSIRFPANREGTTWVLVGSDSRSALPPGPRLYGTIALSPGAHADAVIVVHQDAAGTTLISIPRDILVSPQPGEISRLTLTLNQGPQQLVNGLCRSLGIPATHLVIITMNGFAGAVDAVGGVTINNPTPIRDLYSGLDLTKTGRVHLNGIQALALVRSRHPETLTSSGWTAASLNAGDSDRTYWIGVMFRALASKARHSLTNPFAVQSLAWDLTSGLTTDNHTGLTALLGLRLTGARIVDLPVQELGSDGVGATADNATHMALVEAGYTQSCQ